MTDWDVMSNKETASKSNDCASSFGERLPTSRDVAQLAGVSQSSVCRVFDAKWADRISPKMRDRVLAAANALGYQPNAIARSLTAQRSGIIGVIVSEYFNEFYFDLMRLITNELQALGMRVMLFNAAPYSDIEEVFNKLVEYRVDGIIVTAAAISTRAEPIRKTISTPLVLVNIYANEPFCSSVVCDNYTGSRQMAHYLYKCGCRNFVYASAANSAYFDIPDRYRGFRDGLQECGADCRVVDGDYSYEAGKEVARLLFTGSNPPDCIFTTSSKMAHGIMDSARQEFGISIPNQLSVATYDDSFATALDSYQLTTIRQPSEAIARTAVRLLCQEIDDPGCQIETVYAPPSITVRNSVRKPTTGRSE